MSVFDRHLSGADTSLVALTPEGIEFVLFPAGLPVRACAYAIDKVIQGLILLVVWMVSSLGGGAWLMLILNFCVEWFYHVFFELAFRGQSPGKYCMGIRVVRSDGAPVDGASSFLRNLLRFADTFCCLCPIALVSMAASGGFRRLGDWAGSTLVVYAPGSMHLARRTGGGSAGSAAELSDAMSWLAVLNPVVPARPLSAEEKQAVLVFARRYPLLGEARADEIAHAWAAHLRDENNLLQGNASPGTPETLSDAAYLLGIAKTLLGAAPLERGNGAEGQRGLA